MMKDFEFEQAAKSHTGRLEIFLVFFQRVVSFFCLFSGVFYYASLTGLFFDESWRFDLAPVCRQVGNMVLAIFFPFAATGLWMGASWGFVLWFVCILTLGGLYFFCPEMSGKEKLFCLLHLLNFIFTMAAKNIKK